MCMDAQVLSRDRAIIPTRANMHICYGLYVADLLSQARDLLCEIGLRNKRFRHKSSGFLNQSKLARAIGVEPSTVSRILHLDREPAESEWFPRQQILRGLVNLTPAENEEQVLEMIRDSEPHPIGVYLQLIRPKRRRNKKRNPTK